MKKAAGYVTDDGTFFESEQEARLHETETVLRAKLITVNGAVDPDRFLALVLNVMLELRGFLDAYFAADTVKRSQTEDEDRAETGGSTSTTIDASLGHVSSTEEDLASLLKLPARGPSHVPDVGSSPRSEKVSKRRAKHGA